MRDKKNENGFLIVSVCCIFVLLMVCYFGIGTSMRGTWAHFGGTTGTLTSFKVTYSSNYPVDTLENSDYVDQRGNIYMMSFNMFSVPDGYEFVSWNTAIDGSGVSYVPEQVTKLTDNLILYAIWEESIPDEPSIAYGDINLDTLISEDDYLLLEEYVNGTGVLEGQVLVNADVNVDGKIDLVDVDIIKQACLGTSSYVGYLPNSPILIYDVYEGNIDIGNGGSGTGDNETGIEDGNETTGGNIGSASGSGSAGGSSSGNSGNGNATSGNNGGSGKHNNSTGKENGNSDKNVSTGDNEVVVVKKMYEFKFMIGDVEYASTTCEVGEDDTCELVLPNDKPSMEGYKFNGWSLTKDCPTNAGTNSSLVVNSSNTYYACFIKVVETEEENNTSYLWIIVFAICAMAIRLIYHLIYKFREAEKMK